MEQVEVWQGRYGDPVPLSGPLRGVRADTALAYEFKLPARFIPWPGRSRLERVFVLLDLGVSMSLPARRSTHGADRAGSAPGTWYVGLVDVIAAQDTITVRDLYINVLVPADGRLQRLLDLDEFADAIEAGHLDLTTAMDGLRRWQHFLDRHLHTARDPQSQWTGFPPQQVRDLAALPAPLGPRLT